MLLRNIGGTNPCMSFEKAFQVHFANQTSQTSLLSLPIWYLFQRKFCAVGIVVEACDAEKQRIVLKYSFGQ